MRGHLGLGDRDRQREGRRKLIVGENDRYGRNIWHHSHRCRRHWNHLRSSRPYQVDPYAFERDRARQQLIEDWEQLRAAHRGGGTSNALNC